MARLPNTGEAKFLAERTWRCRRRHKNPSSDTKGAPRLEQTVKGRRPPAEEIIAAMAERDPILAGLIAKTQSDGAAPNPLVWALALYLQMFYEVWLL
jgi:hypothetical protein